MTDLCAQHGAACAYSGLEPDRCPRCHRSWSKIATDQYPNPRGETREQHTERCGRKPVKRARSS